MMNSNSRFALLDSPIAIPGNCYICGSVGGDGRKFIDLGTTVEFTGVIYFCTLCMSEALTVMGFFSSEQFKISQDALSKTESRVKVLEDECSRLRAIANSVDFLRNNASWPSNDNVSADESTVAEPPANVESDAKNESRPLESANVRGRKNVPNHEPNDNDELDF